MINGLPASAEAQLEEDQPARGGLLRVVIQKAREGRGKIRRFCLSHFCRGYVAKMRSLRRGECRRCGQCCRLCFTCIFLREKNQCAIYDWRFRQCRDFPVDERDLADSRIACGFWFDVEADARPQPDARAGS